MKYSMLMLVAMATGTATAAIAQSQSSCAALAGLKLDGVEITKAELVPPGTSVPPPYPGAPSIGPLPAHCRVDGVINRRKGVGGQEFGIGFAIAITRSELRGFRLIDRENRLLGCVNTPKSKGTLLRSGCRADTSSPKGNC